jgi:hypothetical protein
MSHSRELKAEGREKVSLLKKAFLISALGSLLSALPSLSQADTFDYQIVLDGGHLVVQGANLHEGIGFQLLSGSPLADVIPLTITNLPPGMTYRMPSIDTTGVCCGSYPNYGLYGIGGGTSGGWIQFTAAPSTPPGHYTVTIQATAPTTPATVRSTSLDITVMAPSDLAMPVAPLLPAVPIPHKAEWESAMVTLGASLCKQSDISQYEGGVWYYDGERVFYQIGDYQNESSWQTTCAQWVGNAYLPSILRNNGGEHGYEVFTRGFRMDAEKTGSMASKQAVHLLASAASYAYPHTTTNPLAMRENSYALEALLDDEAVNGAVYAFDTKTMEGMLGQLDQIFISKQFNVYYSPFMVGLMANALIQYYTEKNPDPRIPYYLKKALDGLWDLTWSDTEHGFNYQCWPDGCYSTPSDAGYYPPAGPHSHVVFPNLNLLIAPAYAWMYLHTGDPKDRERADTIFSDGVVYSDWYQGKQFSQNMRWSFDYVKWREQANAQAGPLPTNAAPPVIAISSPIANTVLSGSAPLMSTVSGSVPIVGVQFLIDGVNAGAPISATPFETKVLTYLFSNGPHTLTAIAYDAAGHSTPSGPVSITINNLTTNPYFQQCPSATLPTGAYQACYYNGASRDYNGMYGNGVWTDANFGNLVRTQTDAKIDFDWGTTSPAPGINDSFYGVIWQGNFNFPAGRVKFSLSRNIGFRIYIDNQLIGPWYTWSPDIPTPIYPLAPTFEETFPVSGTHRIRVEAWVGYNAPPPSIHLSWALDNGAAAPRAPVVEWFDPMYGTGYPLGSNVSLTVKAFGLDKATIQKVDFYNGAASLGSVTTAAGNNQYTLTWPNAPRGTYQLLAKATDSNGVVTTKQSNPIAIDDPPTVRWISPPDGATFPYGSDITFTVSATPVSGHTLTGVNFNNSAVATLGSPGQYSWTWTSVTDGTFPLTAYVTDSNGVTAQSSTIHIQVISSSPTLTWVSPPSLSGFTPGTDIPIVVSAAGTFGATIQKVEVLEPGVGWVPATLSNGQYRFTWPQVPAGTFQLNTRATDTNGRQTSLSSNIEIGVHNPPTLSWVSPGSGGVYSIGAPIPLTALASADGGAVILQVDFFSNGTLIGSASSLEAGGHYTFNWKTAPLGTYTITARAVDSNGLQSALSAPVSLTVNTAMAPVLSWPSIVSIHQVLQLNFGSLPVSQVQWEFVPVSGNAGTSGMASTRTQAPGTASFSTGATEAFTPAQHGLTTGTYQLTVKLISSAGVLLAQATQSITLVESNLSAVKIFPNPWRSDRHAGKSITFDGVTFGTTIKLFTVSAREIKELHTDGPTIAWDLTNDSGDKVGSGIYIYQIIDSQGDKVRGKVAVIK